MNDNDIEVDIIPWTRTREIVCWARMGGRDSEISRPHTPFNPSLERGVSGAKRFRDDYEITFLAVHTSMEVQIGGRG